MMHLTERVGGDFGPAYRYYCSLEQEMYAGKVSWRDSIGKRRRESIYWK